MRTRNGRKIPKRNMTTQWHSHTHTLTNTWTHEDSDTKRSILTADRKTKINLSKQQSLMWIVRASLTILAIKFTLSHQLHSYTHKHKRNTAARMHYTHKHTEAIQKKRSETWKSQITHLCNLCGQRKETANKQKRERKRNTNEKKKKRTLKRVTSAGAKKKKQERRTRTTTNNTQKYT